jgi:rhamnosyltransferase
MLPVPSRGEQAMKPPVPAAIVLYRSDFGLLGALLDAMARGGRRIFIFANGETSSAVDALLAALPNASVVRSPTNLGLGHALNELAIRAFAEGHDQLILLDQDSGPGPTLPEALRDRRPALTSTLGPIAAVGPSLTPGGDGYRSVRYYWRNKVQGLAAFLPTSGTLLDAEAFRNVGTFRADYFVGAIDVEWGLRAQRLGYGVVVARDLTMPHRWGTAAGADRRFAPQILRQPLDRNYYHIRNSVDLLTSAQAPLLLSFRLSATLALQLGLLTLSGGHRRDVRQMMAAALSDGFAHRLGPRVATPLPSSVA